MPLWTLPSSLVERIAAGEVIQGPASVVKELVENALDAGASSVCVWVWGGGLEAVQVSDDGCGIPAAELERAFHHFTTSKLASPDDLGRVTTLGFRGEALACIAALADVEVVSRTEGALAAAQLALRCSEVTERRQAARSRGTTVTVRRLFQDEPERRRLDRRREEAKTVQVVRGYALAHPHVRFELHLDGRPVLSTSGSGSLAGALAEIYGPHLASNMTAFGPLGDDRVQVRGLVSRPPASRPGRHHLHVSVNGRPVGSSPLLEALEAALRPVFPKGRFPVAVIHVLSPPWAVDVNLSPTKDRVHLLFEQEALALLREAVRDALRAGPPSLSRERARGLALVASWPQATPAGPPPQPEQPLSLLGQLMGTFLLAEGPEGLYVIDQHRAHERALYDLLLARRGGDRVPLTEPLLLELRPHQAVLLQRSPGLLEELGFSLEVFGPYHFLVREVPALLDGLEASALEEALRDALHDEGWLERLLGSLACRLAVRRGRALTEEEMGQILAAYRAPGAPVLCPHGGPIAFVVGKELLARQLDIPLR